MSISGFSVWKTGRFGTSQQAAKEGSALIATVVDAASSPQTVEAIADRIEAAGQHGKQGFARRRQIDAAMTAGEQRFADRRFQFSHLPADGGLRDEQLVRGKRKALQPAGDLEAAQGCQGEASALHP